jgi:hypothetical protein
MAAPELEFAETVSKLLADLGKTRLEYITAEFQPFSNQQRPDVVFLPKAGGYAGRTIFVEIKLSTKTLVEARSFSHLLEHKTFAEEAMECIVARYIFVTA